VSGVIPTELTLIRHGESTGNVARAAAMAADAAIIEIAGTDLDVGLTPLGEEQSLVLGRWFAREGIGADRLIASPYRRTIQTAERIEAGSGWTVEIELDERIREKEFGLLNRLTHRGIQERYPEEAAARRRIGKFDYRPPQGESWVDVIARANDFYRSLCERPRAERVVVVTHQVVVMCLRYVIEGLDEAQLLAIDRAGDVKNCALTRYRAGTAGLELITYNSLEALAAMRAPLTADPSPPVHEAENGR